MHIEEFKLERLQSLWENKVEINLTESGIHPYTLRELLDESELDALLDLRLGYGWTDGDPALRDAIAQHYPRAHRENVLVTNGSAEANFLAMWTLLEPGDEIAMMLPNYMQNWGVARALGVEVKPFHLREDAAWSPDLDGLEAAVTSRTKMIVVCNPNNPTGAVLSRPEMDAIIRIADRVGAIVYADEVYKGVELNGEEGPSFHDLYDRAIVAAGLSKALAHPGLRIGWLVGPEPFIADAWHRNDYTTITTALPSEYVATRILEPARRQQILDRNRRMLRENLGVLNDWLASQQRADQGPDQTTAWTFTPPRAGGMAFLRYPHPIGSTALATRLREERNILVLPGDVYGMDHYLRLGIGERRDVLAKGLDILGAFLATIQGDAQSI
jgi:aspartate/methionine/tyrosine aminotransferase